MYKYTLTQPTLHLTLPHPTNLTPSFSSSSSRSYMEVVEETMGGNDHFLVLEGPHSKRPRSSSLGSASNFGGEGGDGNGYGHGNDGNSSSGTTSTIEFFKNTEEEEDMANCLILLAHGRNKNTEQMQNRRKRVKTGEGLESYECKTCNKSFPSFQALGGHRASHKRPKGMINEEKKDLGEGRSDSINAKSDQSLVLPADHNNMAGSNTSKPKVHECSICGSEFSSGQALGGHMRRHRNTIASMKMTKEHEKDEKSRNVYALDLNLPAPEDDIFSSKQPPLVFSAPPLVNCHY